ncbi:hypothetical protein J2Z44_002718 [Clostridium punense]|uniref:Uncharacterized protein n=1 Tax=Clostridium punense TaxID=1054297 RepID=A0ABS4K555_9CLOT|nr:hypothetical protein [Clostridium punense]
MRNFKFWTVLYRNILNKIKTKIIRIVLIFNELISIIIY